MLILTRKPGESVYIGDDIKITIVELKGHQIRVGIDAPKDYRIYREEIYLQILEENRKAAEAAFGSEAEALEGLSQAWGGKSGGDGDEDKPPREGLSVPLGAPRPAMLGSFNAGKAGDPDVVVKRKRARKIDE